MGAMERVRMDKEPPYIGQKPGKFDLHSPQRADAVYFTIGLTFRFVFIGESAPSSERPNPSEQPTRPENKQRIFIEPVSRNRGASTTNDSRTRTLTTTNDHNNT